MRLRRLLEDAPWPASLNDGAGRSTMPLIQDKLVMPIKRQLEAALGLEAIS
jgi:hypothetical protein